MPSGIAVHLYCIGRAVNFFHPAGHVTLGVDSTLQLDHCNVTTLFGDGTSNGTASSSLATFFVGSDSAQVVYINSAVRQFHTVRFLHPLFLLIRYISPYQRLAPT